MIQTKTIDGVLLRDMVVMGAALLEKNREAVDALNVFPVPDGDTGTNMSLTMASATKEVNQKEYLSAGAAAGVHHAGLRKRRQHLLGLLQNGLARGKDAGKQRVIILRGALGLLYGLLGNHARHG